MARLWRLSQFLRGAWERHFPDEAARGHACPVLPKACPRLPSTACSCAAVELCRCLTWTQVGAYHWLLSSLDLLEGLQQMPMVMLHLPTGRFWGALETSRLHMVMLVEGLYSMLS